MISKTFMKVASCVLLAVSLISYSMPVEAFIPKPPVQSSATIKSDFNRTAQSIWQARLTLGRRRKQNVKQPAHDVTQEKVWKDFINHLLLREGKRNTVYRDSLGKPTVGVGHLVTPRDNLKVGDTITDAHIRDLLQQDAKKAFDSAVQQAAELGVHDNDFIVALGSVNFQLGTKWRSKFPTTWRHLMNGNYEQAIRNIERSLWARQTPVRTKDFVQAIRSVMQQDRTMNTVSLDPAFMSQVIQNQQMPVVQYG